MIYATDKPNRLALEILPGYLLLMKDTLYYALVS